MSQGQRILLVEDSKLDAMLFERTMHLNGFHGHIKVAQSIADAISYIQETRNDLKQIPQMIVLDMFLNGDYGEDLLKFLDSEPELDIRVVVISASKPIIDNANILSYSSVIDMLDKPFTYDTFGAILNAQ